MNYLKPNFWLRSPGLTRKAAARRAPTTRLTVDRLESRETPSITPGLIHVNTLTALNQSESASAAAPNGVKVVVWTDHTSASRSEIHAQRFSAAGAKVGGEIAVSSTMTLSDFHPSVGMDNLGNFAVAYQRSLANGDQDIFLQRVSSGGALLGAAIPVANSTRDETWPSVAVNPLGGIVVAYSYRNGGALAPTFVYAREFFASGNPFVKVAVSVPRNGASADEPAVAWGRQGTAGYFYSVAYTFSQYNSAHQYVHGLYVKTFSSVGTLQHSYLAAPLLDREVNRPAVAMDNSANTLVAWQQWNSSAGHSEIFARKFSASGMVGPVARIGLSTSDLVEPSVAMNLAGGSFVVAYLYRSQSTIYGVNVAEMNANGTTRHIYTIQGYSVAGKPRYYRPAISIDGNRNYLASFTVTNGTYYIGSMPQVDALDGVFARQGNLM